MCILPAPCTIGSTIKAEISLPLCSKISLKASRAISVSSLEVVSGTGVWILLINIGS